MSATSWLAPPSKTRSENCNERCTGRPRPTPGDASTRCMGKRLAAPVEQIVQEVNRYLRGWAGYFRYGNSAMHFDQIRSFAVRRLALFVGIRRKRRFSYGWHQVVYQSPDRMGLISLNGSVVAPRANKPWREKPNAVGERRR